jgi:DNA-binding transcriptional LysR family regulator
VLPSTGRVLVSELFEHLRQHAPGVRLHVMEAFTGLLDEYRNAGRIDLSVVNRYRRAELRDEPLGTFDMYLVGPAGDSVTAGETIEFRKLDRLPLVLPGLPSELRIRLEQHARKLGVHLEIVLEVEALVTMREVIPRSRIYTVLPSYAVAQEVEQRSLSISRIVKPSLRRVMCLDISSARPTSLATREVARAIRTITKRLMADGTWPRSLQA